MRLRIGARSKNVRMAAATDSEEEVVPSRRWLVLLIVQIVTLLFGMAITASTIVLPHIRGALSINHDQAAWTVTLFLVGAAVGTPITGWLAGKLGWRRLMVTTLIGFTLSSIACGLAGNLGVLLVARTLQGLFGAPLTPLGQGMLLATFPKRMHALVLMLWGVGGVMGPVLGPILGGVVGEALGWRWTFLFLAPVGLLATLLALVALGDQQKGSSGKLGLMGFISLATAMGALQLMLDRGHRLDWFESFEITTELILALFAAGLFILHTAWSKNPFMQKELFSNWNFMFGLLVMLVMGALSYTPIALFPTLLQDLREYPDATVGFILSSRGLGNFGSFLIVVQFTKYHPRLALTVGILLQVWAGWAMSRLNINMTDWDIIWTNFVQGFGFGLAYTPMTVLAFATLPNKLVVQGASMFNLMRNFGSSLFISISILVLLRTTAANYAGLSQLVSPLNEKITNSPISSTWGLESLESLTRLTTEIEHQALIGGYLNAFDLFTWVALASVPLAWVFKSKSTGTLKT